jgi:hypothetical protein
VTLDEVKALVRRLGATEVATLEDVVSGITTLGFRFVYAGTAYCESMRVEGDDVAKARAALPRALFVVACETIVPKLLTKRGAIALTEQEAALVRQGLERLESSKETRELTARFKEIVS